MKVFTLACLVLIQTYQMYCIIYERPADSDLRGSDADFIMSIDPIVDFELNISDECQKIGICEDIPEYPEDAVNQIIKALMLKLIPFNKDKLIDDADVSHEHGDPLCKSRPVPFVPKAAANNAGDWFLVLNTDKHMVQKFNGERCEKLNAPCDKKVNFEFGFHGNCTQKFMLREMIVLNENMDKVMKKYLQIPSCCWCNIIREEPKS